MCKNEHSSFLFSLRKKTHCECIGLLYKCICPVKKEKSQQSLEEENTK